jgi:O-antigen/teichoic acid export membrane protein
MTLLKKASRSLLWNSAGKALEYCLLYVLSILVARGLGLYQNGVYATLISVVQVLLVLSSVGLETALNKTIPQVEGPGAPSRIRFLLLRAVALRVTVFLLAIVLLLLAIRLFHLYSVESLTEYLVLLFVYAGIRSLTTLVTTSITALFRTDIVSIVGVGMRVIEVAVILSLGGISIPVLLTLFAATGALQMVISLSLLRRSLIGDLAPHALRPFFTFGAVYWINSVVDYFLGRHGDVLLLAGLTSDPSQASMYDVAFSLTQLAALALTLGFGGVTFATFSELALGPDAAFDRFYGFLLRLISFLTLPLYAFLFFNAKPIIAFLYSPAFAGSATLVQGMVLFKIASRLFGGGENTEYLLARGRVGWVSSAGAAAALTNVGLDVILIPVYGAFGAVLGSGCANLLVNAATRMLVLRSSTIPLQFVSWAKLTIAALVVSGAVSTLLVAENPVSLFGRACMFTIGIVISTALLKPFDAVDVTLLEEVSPALARRFTIFATRKRRAEGFAP